MIKDAAISADGKYLCYRVIGFKGLYERAAFTNLIVCDTRQKWKFTMEGELTCQLSANIRYAILTIADSVGILKLGQNEVKWQSNVLRHELDGAELIFLTRDHIFNILNLQTKKVKTISGVEKFWYDKKNHLIVLSQLHPENEVRLSWLDIRSGRIKAFLTGVSARELQFAGNGDIAFSSIAANETTINYCTRFTSHPVKLKIIPSSKISLQQFSIDSRYLFIAEQFKLPSTKKQFDDNTVRIWNTLDNFLTSHEPSSDVKFVLSAISVETKKSIPLDTTDFPYSPRNNGKTTWLATPDASASTDKFWKPAFAYPPHEKALIDLSTGNPTDLPVDIEWRHFSKIGDNVIGYDAKRKQFVSYDIRNKTIDLLIDDPMAEKKGNDSSSISLKGEILYSSLPYKNTDFADRNGMKPVKAGQANAWLMLLQNATEFPNLYYTTDHKHFKAITDYQPQKAFNWYTTELKSFVTEAGDSLKGVLYKPENIDLSKKYPVIFYYYEKLSNDLNWFQFPALSRGDLLPGYMASNGYLVFTPDIENHVGRPGNSALDAVIAAANMLVKLPFVDSTKMGLQGHSFGGYETNYIVTHSPQFKAACTASGLTDIPSEYLYRTKPSYGAEFVETGQFNMGTTLWQDKAAYIDESPIYRVDKVNTPILIMHTRNDGAVPFEQGMAFFLALRRLEKPAWLLEYPGEDHILMKKENQIDYTIKVQEFFDYYLKGASEPAWMKSSVKN